MRRIVLAVCIAVFVFSCGPYRASRNPNPLQETEHIILKTHVLTRYLNVVKQKVERLPAGNLKIKLAIENEEDDDLWTDVQVIFLDKDGFELESTNWEPFMWHGRKVTTFEKVSLSPKAADYRVLIREIKK